MNLYLANHYSEQLVNNKSCRIGADAMATDIATLGESTRNPSGYLKGKTGRRRILERGWRAFVSVADDNGIPDTGDTIRIHRAMFPGLPDPTQVATTDFDKLWAHHGEFAISWALDLTAVPSDSILLRFVNPVNHQMVTYAYRSTVRVIDPWPTHRPRYHGYSDKRLRQDVRKAAEAINGGVILADLYPVGGWTEAAMATDDLKAQKERTKEVWGLVTAARGTIDARDREIADLTEQLTECREDGPDAGREQLLDDLEDWISEKRL